MMIDRNTPWRQIGPVTFSCWESTILGAGGPKELAGRACWLAAGEHSGALLDKLGRESGYGSKKNRNDPAITKNPFSLRRYIPQGDRPGVPDSQNEDNPNGYLHFATWAEGVEACRLRITDPAVFAAQTYNAENPYPGTRTLAQLIYAFSPPGPDGRWNDTEGLIQQAIRNLNSYAYEPVVSIPPGEDPMSDTPRTGRVPKPKVTKAHVWKPVHQGSGWGYDFVPGGRKPVGMTHHEWLGKGTRAFHMRFFACAASPCPSGYLCAGGERCSSALVDYIILQNGEIIEINDPFGVRAGWASGGGVGLPGGLEGDGPAFVAKFGISAINSRTVAVEYQKLDNENFTPEQIASGGALAAWIHDGDGQLWHEHPYTSKYGLVTSFLHFEFGTTSCGKNELDDITKVQAVTKQIMRQHQEQITVPDPIPPSVPPLPDPEIPGGLTIAEAKKRFGEARRHRNGQITTGHGFDAKGPISLAWAHRAAIEHEWPAIEDWYVLEDSGELFQIVTFSNDWRLVQAAERAGWTWMDFKLIELPDAA